MQIIIKKYVLYTKGVIVNIISEKGKNTVSFDVFSLEVVGRGSFVHHSFFSSSNSSIKEEDGLFLSDSDFSFDADFFSLFFSTDSLFSFYLSGF